MESSGSGVTFSESDVAQCQKVIGLLSKADFKLGAAQVIEAAQALIWLQKDLLKAMNDNVMELKRVIQPPKPVEDKPKAKGKV